jgi:hypothetical protein
VSKIQHVRSKFGIIVGSLLNIYHISAKLMVQGYTECEIPSNVRAGCVCSVEGPRKSSGSSVPLREDVMRRVKCQTHVRVA